MRLLDNSGQIRFSEIRTSTATSGAACCPPTDAIRVPVVPLAGSNCLFACGARREFQRFLEFRYQLEAFCSVVAVRHRVLSSGYDESKLHALLDLLQLADSALPIGAAAHSFGLEMLAEERLLRAETALSFFREYLSEAGLLEAAFVRRAWRGENPQLLNDEFSARRVARESREAALKLGRRFSQLLNALVGDAVLADHLSYPIAFGLAGAHLGIAEEAITAAYLRQSLAGLISACQRLMPLGQVAASGIIWNLKSAIAAAVLASENREVGCFNPLPEVASMRHGSLETRLFIS
jgi:urease accessory protein